MFQLSESLNSEVQNHEMQNSQVPSNEVPSNMNMYDAKVKENFHVYGIASLIYAVIYTLCMYRNSSGISHLFFVASTIVYICFCMGKLEIQRKKDSIFYFVSMLLLSVSTFITDDGRIIFFNKLGIFLLSVSMLLSVLYDTQRWNLGKYLGSILKVCFMALVELGRPFVDAAWYCKNKLDKKNSKYLYVLLGFVITIPLFLIVFSLLSSADAVFRDLAAQLTRNWSGADIFLIILMTGMMFIGSYCFLTYLCKQTIQEEVKDSRKWEPLVGIPVASILTILYLVFSVIQIVYLFMGNMQLPAGYTYAEYAREGFFQLLAVSIMNLVLVLIGLYFFKPSKVLKGILTVMSLCTFIMIASSAMRMIIYIQYYYLTFLRILVLWTLALLALIFAGVIIYVLKEDFPLFRYSMVVVTCLYIGLSFSHPDYWIAKVNLAGTQDNRSEFFQGEAYEDYYFLSGLNADAAPIMVPWIAEQGYELEYYYQEFDIDDLHTKDYYAYRYLNHLRYRVGEVGVWNFNLSRFLAETEVTMGITKGM